MDIDSAFNVIAASSEIDIAQIIRGNVINYLISRLNNSSIFFKQKEEKTNFQKNKK
jgi:hypothetical protein